MNPVENLPKRQATSAVAVAGGTQGLGRAIVEQLIAGGYQVIVLSRKSSSQTALGYRIVAVDYTNVDGLVDALEENDVETIISTISFVMDAQPEVNLMRAADISRKTTRYVPSIFGPFRYEEKHEKVLPMVTSKLNTILQELKNISTLEYTVFYNGYFLDSFGNGRVKSYLQQILPVVVDVAHNTAAVPGSGNTPVAFSHTFDIAKFVVATLSLEKWPKESWLIGDKVTWNEFVKLAEDAKGVKFNVCFDSIATLQSGKTTELPSHVPMYDFMPKEQVQLLYANFGLWFDNGEFDLKPESTVQEAFPDIKTITVKEFLDQSWKEV